MNRNIEEEKQIEEPSKRRKLLPLILIGVVIGSLWALTPLLIKRLYPDPVPLTPEALALVIAQRGQFGDMFGAVNALFSGLAFLGAIYALILQSRELELQRQELIESRKEMATQSRVFSDQLELQRLEMQRSLEPMFSTERTSIGRAGTELRVTNHRAAVLELSIAIDPPIDGYSVQLEGRGEGGTWTLRIAIPPDESPHWYANRFPEMGLRFNYVDLLGRSCCKRHRLVDGSKLMVLRAEK